MPSAMTAPVHLRSPGSTKQCAKARQAQQADLQSYIPFGTLALESSQLSFHSHNDWRELEAAEVAATTKQWSCHLALLLRTAWCRAFVKPCVREQFLLIRVFLLPDDVGRAEVIRNDGRGRSSLRAILDVIDRSQRAWEDDDLPMEPHLPYLTEKADDESLFYMFNTLSSPDPDPSSVDDAFSSQTMQDMLDGRLESQGIKTELYQYQRRSAAAMIQRESQPQTQCDPRLEKVFGPQNNPFYIDRFANRFYLSERWFQGPRGGILAETMGYGKTLICLALILATKGNLPEVPPDQINDILQPRQETGCQTLAMQAAATAARYNVQWRLWFAAQRKAGYLYNKCVRLLHENASTYTVETTKGRSRNPVITRNTYRIVPTTLVVVPANLLQQWEWQMKEHLQLDALSVLIVDERSIAIPDAARIHEYDLIITSGERFEEEINPFRGHADPDSLIGCCCSDPNRRRLCQQHPYKSPFLETHFLRFIVDEGVRFMSSESKTQAMSALQAIRVERKWIVSGTPARSLIGAEVELAAEQNDVEDIEQSQTPSNASTPSELSDQTGSSVLSKMQRSLAGRKRTTDAEEERRTISRLGTIVKSFLEMQPWASPDSNDGAHWNVYFVSNKTGTKQMLSLRNVLNNVVVRHKYEDLILDLRLPELENKYVLLEPSFMDKLSMNLFLVSLIVNAVTSERKDQDYMFHPRNRKSLEILVRNLRHSAFFWCGLKPTELETTCEISMKYLEKSDITIAEENRILMINAMRVANIALKNPAWRAFAETSEIGLFVQDFPVEAAEAWALCKPQNADHKPLLLSATALRSAQHKVEGRLYSHDPMSVLDIAPPQTALATADNPKSGPDMEARNGQNSSPNARSKKPSTAAVMLDGTSETIKQRTSSTVAQSAIQNSQISVTSRATSNASTIWSQKQASVHPAIHKGSQPAQKSILKKIERKPDIPAKYRIVAGPKLIGTPSAKLSYLLDRILALYRSEKILVFYEGDDIAYYCAQVLEILEIPHRIYAAGIKKQLRNQYQDEFNNNESIRVMLVDLNQAALGLHLASASRVFFINPVWQPGLEAQAIKRAHRIGSTKDIKIETLVLKGTVEESLLERRESMNADEHRKASRSLLDDAPMKRILEETKLLPISSTELVDDEAHLAKLQNPQQVFARSIAMAYQGNEAMLSALSAQASQLQAGQDAVDHPLRPDSIEPEAQSAELEKRGLKRKLKFVDEFEQRTTNKARKYPSVSGDQENQRELSISNGTSLRRIRFADENKMPLYVTHRYEWSSEGE